MTAEELLTPDEQEARIEFFQAIDKAEEERKNKRDDKRDRQEFFLNHYRSVQQREQSTTLRKIDDYIGPVTLNTVQYPIFKTDNYSGAIRRDDKGIITSYGKYQFSTFSTIIFNVRVEASSYDDLMTVLGSVKA